LNDVNILDRSSIIAGIMSQIFDTRVNTYKLNGRKRAWVYFLMDGIYPPWSIFAKTLPFLAFENELTYAKMHKYVRKDIKRAFGVLVSKFSILERQLRKWCVDNLRTLIDCCMIINNMTILGRRDNYTFNDLRDDLAQETENDSDENADIVESLFSEEANLNDDDIRDLFSS